MGFGIGLIWGLIFASCLLHSSGPKEYIPPPYVCKLGDETVVDKKWGISAALCKDLGHCVGLDTSAHPITDGMTDVYRITWCRDMNNKVTENIVELPHEDRSN